MSADLHIHVLKNVTEADIAAFKSNIIGSKYFNLATAAARQRISVSDMYEAISDTPNVWVGEVSWLKAALSKSEEEFIPDPVNQINEIIGEDLPVIDDELIEKILGAIKAENKTSYSVDNGEDIFQFLCEYKGEKAFTVSW